MESYVSSLAIGNSSITNKKPTTNRAIQQSKINAVLKGINEALDTYTEDTTEQPYGTLIYSGPISSIHFDSIVKPKSSIPISGTIADGTTVWVGTVDSLGIYRKIDQSLSKCDHVERYEKTYGTESGRHVCWRRCNIRYPDPYFPSTRENRYNRCNFKTANCVGGISSIQEGYCECYILDYPVNTTVRYELQCNWWWKEEYDPITCQYVGHWEVDYTYMTCSTWTDCHAEYCYKNYDSISDYSMADIQIYQKYKKT